MQLALLVDVGFDDASGEGGGGFCSPASVFVEDHDDDVGIAAGRDAHEPGVGALRALAQTLYAGRVVDDLRGTRLAAEINALEVRGECRSAGAVDRVVHAVGDGLPGGR